MAIQAEVVRAYLDRHPDLPSRQVARILHATQPAVFPTFERAYGVVRNIRGTHGRKTRTSRMATHPRDPERAAVAEAWGCLLPAPDPTDWKECSLPAEVKRWLVVADLHIPYYSREALILTVDYAKRAGCTGLLIDGDLYDAHHISDYLRDPRKRRFVGELDMTNQILDAIGAEWNPRETVWKQGNHDDRHSRYMAARAPEMAELAAKSVEEYLRVEERGMVVFPSMSAIRVGKLGIIHGHELPRGISSPVNPARGAFLRATSCVLVAHSHQTSQHTMTTFDGLNLTCWSIGCLCDLHPTFRPINNWNWGFAILDTPSCGSWSVDNKRIVNGEVV
ncbi:MAG TPA: hypothetical protein PKM13_06375 [Candidatus Bipolaricaulis anaerobius]|nr:hypothetical protein [Candidatus Bipolaricaulis anaerobius]